MTRSDDMIQVLYDSRGGNTRKIANAMAEEMGTKAASVKSASMGPGNDVLFLGSGCYGGKPGKDMQKFIEINDFRGRRVALFGTSGGGQGQEVKAMEEALKGKGAGVAGSYYCPGKMFLLFSRGHPDAADIAAARKFAKGMSK
jgi:flavodoxin